jgi:hypothetical protein
MIMDVRNFHPPKTELAGWRTRKTDGFIAVQVWRAENQVEVTM